MMRRKTFMAFIVVFVILSARAQPDLVELSLAEALSQASEFNAEVHLSDYNAKIAQADYRKSSAAFLPRITIAETGMKSNDALSAFGFLLQQRVVEAADFNPDRLNNPDAQVNWMTQFSIQQPILNADALYARKAAYYQKEVQQLKKQHTKDHISLMVKKNYFALVVANKNAKVLEESLKAMNQVYASSKHKFKEGYMTEADLLAIELRVLDLEDKLQLSIHQSKKLNDQLSLLISGEIGVFYRPTDSLMLGNQIENGARVPSERSDLQALRLGLSASYMQQKSAMMAFMPRVNAFANYSLYDKEFLGFGSTSYLVGLSLQWSLFHGGQQWFEKERLKIQTAKTERMLKQAEQQAGLEMNQTLNALEQAMEHVQTMSKAVQHAQRAYEIRKDLFDQGMQELSGLMLAESQLSEVKLAYQLAVYKAFLQQANLEFQQTIN